MSEKNKPWWEIGVGVATIVLCALFYWDSLSLRKPIFEILGSAMVPRVTCGVLAAFALAIVAKGVARLRTRAAAAGAGEALDYVPRPGRAAGLYVLTAAYILLLSTDVLRFSELTMVFLPVAGLLVTRFRLRPLPLLLILGAIMGYGGQYLFTKVFFVDLP